MITNIFRKMCLIRYFEEALMANKERIHLPVYLSMGQEATAATLSEICFDYRVFPQHRGHAVYLAFGGSPEKLRDEILGRKTGCCCGMGGSSDIQCDKVESHHGLLGENIPLATGYAFGSRKPTIAYFGDGAIEEDYAGVSLGFAATHKLPVLFVCIDNNLAILTPIKDRRNWKATDLAKGYGLDTADIKDRPEEIIEVSQELKLPALVNIKTIRHRWHVGFGKDQEPEIDRLDYVRKLVDYADRIEEQTKKEMFELWQH